MNILDKTIQEIALKKAANIDCLVSRFCIENDLRAEEVEIINEMTTTGYKIYVKKRDVGSKIHNQVSVPLGN